MPVVSHICLLAFHPPFELVNLDLYATQAARANVHNHTNNLTKIKWIVFHFFFAAIVWLFVCRQCDTVSLPCESKTTLAHSFCNSLLHFRFVKLLPEKNWFRDFETEKQFERFDENTIYTLDVKWKNKVMWTRFFRPIFWTKNLNALLESPILSQQNTARLV